MAAQPPRSDDPGALARLKEALVASDYTHDGLRRVLGQSLTPAPAEIPLTERRLPPGERITTIIRLFLLDLSVARADAATALAPLGVEGAEALGLVASGDGEVRPLLRVTPSGELYFASDRRLGDREGVMGVAPSSALLGNLTVRRPIERALDVGTGSGILAVLAARHAERVVATDLSERALAFAAFNAALNGFENVEFRQGSFFEPVAGERFGLVNSNPPFVISPDTSFTYRDAGLERDGVSELVARKAAAHLEEGGFAQMLATWVHEPEGDWAAPVRAWLDGSGCDAVLLRYVSDDPLTYAGRWNPPHQTPELGATLDRWLEHYRALGIEAIAFGAISLRRRSGTNWVQAEDVPEQIVPAADHVERLFAAQDFLASGDLLDARLVLVDGHVLRQALHLEDGNFQVKAAKISLDEGLGFEAGIDLYTAHLVSQLDGRRTLREAIELSAAALAPEEVSRERFAEGLIPSLRRMVELGFLVPPL